MSKAPTVIRFQAQVFQVRTLVDGGINVTLALTDKEIAQVSKLLECKKRNAMLEIAAVAIEPEARIIEKHVSKKRIQRYPYKA